MRSRFPFSPATFSSRFIISSVLLTGCLSSISALASTQNPNAIYPGDFGASLSGMFGDNSIGYGDAMIPLLGRNTSFFYLDPQVLFHDKNEYAGSLGLGKRWLQSEQAGVLGAYVFTDYNHAPSGNSFWFVSPGIERLGKIIDFSANLYVPVSAQKISTGTYYGNQLGIYDYVNFRGNSQYDQLFNTYESVGMGGDAELGFRLPLRNNPKIYLGGYYFSPKDATNIRGGIARLDVPLNNRLTVSLSEGYDNVSYNTIKIGLTYNFAARHNSFDFKGDLADRMLDPVQRNLVSTGSSMTTTTQPIANVYTPTGVQGQEYGNITFFNINANPDKQDGSYEHPFVQFNQANVDAANTIGNTQFYVNTGTYASNSTITLTNDSIWGRETYNDTPFVKPGEGNNRPLFDFSGMTDSNKIWAYTPSLYVIQNGNDITFDSIRLVGNPTANNNNSDQSGIQVANNSTTPVNLTFNNVDSSVFNIAALLVNNGVMNNLTITNSNFHDTVNLGDGLDIWNSSNINTITVDNSHFDNNTFTGMDIIVQNNGRVNTINIKDSSFDNNGKNVFPSSGLYISTGYNTNYPGAIPVILNTTIDNSTFNNNSFGFQTSNVGGNIGNFMINNSTFNDNSYGIKMGSQADNAIMGNVTIAGATIENNSSNGININNNTTGGNSISTGQITIIDSTIDNNATGIYVYNGSGATIAGITVKDSTIDGNQTGIAVNNVTGGKIGSDNTIIVSPLGNNTTQATCTNATVKTADGKVYCSS